MRIGFLINPIAGMGGSVGLKGTDGEALEEARRRGARPSAEERARIALEQIRSLSGVEIHTSGGQMGSDLLKDIGFPHLVVFEPEDPSSAADTRRTCEIFLARKVDLILFCGGDGTAADVFSIVGDKVPILGVPAGVKMHSGVFANSPSIAGDLLLAFIGDRIGTRPGEIMDIDEKEFRSGILRARLIGLALTLDQEGMMQSPKGTITSSSEEDEREEIGHTLADMMEDGLLYIIGPGTTCKAVTDALGIPKTLLGVDLVMNKRMIARDVGEGEIMRHLTRYDRSEIIITPIGAQGFIFGRGNQQISSSVIEKVGKENITVIATPTKLRVTKVLRVDTGDARIDAKLRGYLRVLVAQGREKIMRVE